MKKAVQWVLVLVIVCFGAINVFDTVESIIPESPLKDVVIDSDGVLSRDLILSTMGLEYGEHLTNNHLDSMKARLERLPEVERVLIEKESFGKLSVGIVERQPIASIKRGIWGCLLEDGSFVKSEVYPVNVLPIVSQAKHEKLLVKLLKRIKDSDETMYRIISEIKLDEQADAAVLYLNDGSLKIVVGRDSDFEMLAKKYRTLKNTGMIDSLDKKIVDMRFADFAYLR